MDADSWAALVFLIAALLLLVVVSAAEAAAAAIVLQRTRALVEEGVPEKQALERYGAERRSVTATLALARHILVVAATLIGLFLLVDAVGVRWDAALAAGLSAVVVLGALQALPRALSARTSRFEEPLSRMVAVLTVLLGAPARLLDLPGQLAARLAGPTPEASELEELLGLLAMKERGTIEKEEREMIRGVISLVDTTAREIMVPRIDIVAVDSKETLQKVARLAVERGFSRIPLYEETIDNVVGVIYAKDLLAYLVNGRQPPSLREIARPPYFIPEGKRVDELLTELRQNRVHIAIVVDEYGGTAGLVTIEDLLEEIVGEIEDEYDVGQAPIERLTETEAVLDARVGIDALNELFGLSLEAEEYDTVGGFVFHHLGKMPTVGDEVLADGVRLRVLSLLGNRIKKVRVSKEGAPSRPQDSASAPRGR